ncbi:glycosyltransferase family 4 protein [Arthrobacter sp. MDT2-2]
MEILHAWRFPEDNLRLDIGRAIRHLRRIYEIVTNARPPWMLLDPRITVHNEFVARPRMVRGRDVLIATAAQTAAFAVKANAAAYLVQHYEDWSKGSQYVDNTLRLPMTKIVIAPWLAEKLSQLGHPSILIPNAIDPDDFPKGPPVRKRPLRITAMVSDHKWKRSDLVAQVLNEVRAAVPGAEAHVFGVIQRPDALPDYVRYTRNPTPDQLRHIYQSARVFLCASDQEGWGLPAAEAMLSGAALVSTRNGGVESFAEGVSLLSPSGQGSPLRENIIRLLEEPELCASLADAGHARISAYTPTDAGLAFERAILNASLFTERN